MIAAIAIAVPGFRSRRHDLDAISNARAMLPPATAVSSSLRALQDEGSLSAWWVASGDPSVKPRLEAARVAADRAARRLPGAADAAAAARAPPPPRRPRPPQPHPGAQRERDAAEPGAAVRRPAHHARRRCARLLPRPRQRD